MADPHIIVNLDSVPKFIPKEDSRDRVLSDILWFMQDHYFNILFGKEFYVKEKMRFHALYCRTATILGEELVGLEAAHFRGFSIEKDKIIIHASKEGEKSHGK